jgi:hypothetical protein
MSSLNNSKVFRFKKWLLGVKKPHSGFFNPLPVFTGVSNSVINQRFLKFQNWKSKYYSDNIKPENIKGLQVNSMNDHNQNSINKRLSELEINKSWQKLKNIWKKLNFLETNGQLEVNWQEYFNTLKEDISKVNDLTQNLINENLINTEEKEYLDMLFTRRMDDFNFRFGYMTCYLISPEFDTYFKTREELDQQYCLLQKMFIENKINTETFNTIKENIYDRLLTLENPDQLKNNPGLIDLITFLNS